MYNIPTLEENLKNPQRLTIPASALGLLVISYIAIQIKKYEGPLTKSGRPKFKEFKKWFSFAPFIENDELELELNKNDFKHAWRRVKEQKKQKGKQ